MTACDQPCCQATGVVRAVIDEAVRQEEEYQHILIGGLDVRWRVTTPTKVRVHLLVVTSCPPADYELEPTC